MVHLTFFLRYTMRSCSRQKKNKKKETVGCCWNWFHVGEIQLNLAHLSTPFLSVNIQLNPHLFAKEWNERKSVKGLCAGFYTGVRWRRSNNTGLYNLRECVACAVFAGLVCHREKETDRRPWTQVDNNVHKVPARPLHHPTPLTPHTPCTCLESSYKYAYNIQPSRWNVCQELLRTHRHSDPRNWIQQRNHIFKGNTYI